MADEEGRNPDRPILTDAELARSHGIELPETENKEAVASPDAGEASGDGAGPKEASQPEPRPEPEKKEPDEVERQRERVRELEERLAAIERDYGASSKEAKRLADRLKNADTTLASLKEKYALDELEGWTPEKAEEERPVTYRELQILEEQRKWKTAEETFFASDKNADLSSPAVRRWVVSLLFREDGSLVNKSARDAFELAGKEVRKILNAERLRGRQEREEVKKDINQAAVPKGTGAPPEKKEKPVEEPPDENVYVTERRKFQQKRGIG